ASATPFCLNASSGHLSLAAASAGIASNGRLPRPIRATVAAPFRISRRVAENPWSVEIILNISWACAPLQSLQEVHDRVDLLLGQNPVPSERGHHGQGISFGLVVKDRHEVVTIRVFLLDVGEFRA